jgi:hypothetical protein
MHKCKHIEDYDIPYINTTQKNVVIIIGASPAEPHVIDCSLRYADSIILTISDCPGDDGELEVPENIMHLDFDFNDVKEWKKLTVLDNIKYVIVDWSTAKFFSHEYNILSGGIFDIIMDIINVGGSMYSHCCVTGLQFHQYSTHRETLFDKPPSYIPSVRWIGDQFLSYVDVEEAGPTEEEYMKKMAFYFPANYILNFEQTVDKDHNDYPLVNPRQKYPFRYFVATRLDTR